MMGILAEGAKLERASQVHLKSCGWKVVNGDGNPADFRADKRLLRFNFECVDKSVLTYKGVESIIDLMRSHSRQKQDGIAFVFVLNFDLPFVTFDQLLDAGVLAIRFDELAVLDNLDSFVDDPTRSVSSRDIRMLERNSWACLKVGEHFFRTGDRTQALYWAKIAVHPSNPVSGAHQTAFNWFRSAGDVKGARELAEDAHSRKKDNLFFLQALRQLSIDAGDEQQAESWLAKIKEVELNRPKSLDDILKPKALVGRSNEIAKKAQITKPESFLTKFFRKRT